MHTQASDNAYACPTFDIFGRVFDTPLLLARDSARFGVVRVIVSDNTCRPIIHNLLYATNELSGAYLGGVLRVLEHPPSASSPVLLGTSLLLRGVRRSLFEKRLQRERRTPRNRPGYEAILGTRGSTAGLFNGCSTSVFSNPACISYLLTYESCQIMIAIGR